MREQVSATWRKSSYSTANGDCVEVFMLDAHQETAPVRDSKDPQGPALVFSAGAWSSFVDAVKRGELHA